MPKKHHKPLGLILISLGMLFAVYYIFTALAGNKGFSTSFAVDGDDAYYGYDTAEEASYAPREALPPMMGGVNLTSSYMNTSDMVLDRYEIRRGYLSLVVEHVDESIKTIQNIVTANNGYVEDASISEYGNDQKRGMVTLRIPSDKFDTTFEALKNTSITVTEESVSSNDVTSQVVDIEARLDNLYRVEEQYVDVLEEADTVEDILKVREVLDRTREEIERLEAQQKHLSEQVSLSTITVSLVSEADVEVLGIVWSPLSTVTIAFNNLVLGLTRFVDSLIGFVFFLPLLFVWGLIIYVSLWILWRIVRRVRRSLLGASQTTPSKRKDTTVKVRATKKGSKKNVKKSEKLV